MDSVLLEYLPGRPAQFALSVFKLPSPAAGLVCGVSVPTQPLRLASLWLTHTSLSAISQGTFR